MKKLLLSLPLLCLVLNSFAQINKGSTLLGGNLGFNFYQNGNDPGYSNSNSNIQPYIQFAYQGNRTIGFGLNFSYSSSSNDGTIEHKSSTFNFSPSVNFTQYHSLKGNFGWFLQEKIGAGFYKYKQRDGVNENKSESVVFFANITPGIYYAAGQKKQWLLHASVGGLGGTYSKSGTSKIWSVNSNLFQNYQLGFAYIFQKG